MVRETEGGVGGCGGEAAAREEGVLTTFQGLGAAPCTNCTISSSVNPDQPASRSSGASSAPDLMNVARKQTTWSTTPELVSPELVS